MNKLNYEYIVIRYGELTTKGKNRKDFINCLYRNIKEKLAKFDKLSYEKFYDGLYIHLNGEDYDEVAKNLDKVFGFAYYAGALKVKSEKEEIVDIASEMAIRSNKKTFKVICKRKDKNFPLSSDQMNREIATKILKNSDLKVDVHNPELKIYVNIDKDKTYIMDDKVEGLKGYPLGVNHKALMMLSGGIDSPVAAYLAMKRGMRIECIHFASMPYTSQQALDKVIDLVRILNDYQAEIIVHVIPFTQLQLAIYRNTDESYAITLLRRMMYRIADELAQQRHIKAIVNGESIGQVASQTLDSMEVISEVSKTLIFRPLCMADKLEIIDLAKKIGTYETSILPYEDCCTIFSPKNPSTKPKKEKCEYYESKFDYESLIKECIENREVIKVSKVENSDLF